MSPLLDARPISITPACVEPLSFTGTILASPAAISNNLEVSPQPSAAVAETMNDSEEKRTQVYWDGAIHRNMNLPEGHDRVGVLIVKWADAIDQLGCSDEIAQLREVFEKTFRFETQVLELQNNKKPQHQLSRGIANFVEEYDDPQNLLIVYYSGHGVYIEEKGQFEFHASDCWQRGGRNTHEPRACWNTVENPLLDAEGEVLVIFDSCHASNLMKKGFSTDDKTYELLAACGIDGLAVIPGKNSFTEALIQSLKALAQEHEDRSFTSWHLQQQIIQQTPKHPPFLWNRRRRDDNHIRLAPVKPHAPKRSASWKHHNSKAKYLNLTFQLGIEKLEEEQIEDLTKHLPAAFSKSNVPCHRIDFNSFRSRHEPLRRVVEKVMQHESFRRQSQSGQRGTATNGEVAERPSMRAPSHRETFAQRATVTNGV